MRVAAAGLAASLLAASPALAEPAMWRIADADSQVWLFGSIHFLDAGAEWRTPEFDAALRGSELVYFELILATAQPEALELIAELGAAPEGRTLDSYFDEEAKARWDAAVAAYEIDALALKYMRPWFAAMSLPPKDGPALNFAGGVEALLQAELADARERGLETLEGQLRALADMSDAGQVDLLMRSVEASPLTQSDVDHLTDAWMQGDLEAVTTMLADQIGTRGTEIYDRLIVERNTRWVDEIKAILAGSSDAMVVVGAGHFAGPEGLPTLLAGEGIAVERVQ